MHQNTILRDAEMNPIWQEQDGLLIVEVESVPLKGVHTRALSFKGVWDEWVADTETGGHTGACCYRWGGPELTWNPGSGLSATAFTFRRPATTRWRSEAGQRRRQPATAASSASTEVSGGSFAAAEPGGWSWETRRERGPDQLEPYRETLDAGFHQIEISGRSHGFCIDRLALGRNGITFEDPGPPVSAARPR